MPPPKSSSSSLSSEKISCPTCNPKYKQKIHIKTSPPESPITQLRTNPINKPIPSRVISNALNISRKLINNN